MWRRACGKAGKSVRQHVLEIVASEEFQTKFVRNQPRQNVVQHLHFVLLGQKVTDPYRLARHTADFTLMDLVPYAERLTGSSDYRRLYGEDALPGPAVDVPPKPHCKSIVIRLNLKSRSRTCFATAGWVVEWLKAPVLKTGRPARVSWVRIPPHPP